MIRSMAKAKQFNDSILFLNSHPALNRKPFEFFNDNFRWFTCDVDSYRNMKNVDDNGNEFIEYFRYEPGFYKFYKYRNKPISSKYDVPLNDNNKNAEEYDSIIVPYYVVYGKNWKYEKTTFDGIYNIVKFNGKMKNVNRRKNDKINVFEWFYFDGGNIDDKDTYEDLIIATAEEVKKKYGDVNFGTFYTKDEKTKEKDRINNLTLRILEGSSEFQTIIYNHYSKNLKWWEWFMETDFYKKEFIKQYEE